jgi:hypothetical protein
VVRACAVPACASCRVQVGVGPGGGQQRGGRLGWGGAWGQVLVGSAFYGGRGDLESDSASRRRGALVYCAGQRASVEGDSRRGRSPSTWGPSGFPCSWEAARLEELRCSASRFLPEGTRYRTQTEPCALFVGWGLRGLWMCGGGDVRSDVLGSL